MEHQVWTAIVIIVYVATIINIVDRAGDNIESKRLLISYITVVAVPAFFGWIGMAITMTLGLGALASLIIFELMTLLEID